MKKNIILLKSIKNTRDGYHLNSKFWQESPSDLREIAIGMILSDACMYKISKDALIKFEQGYRSYYIYLQNLKITVL